MSRLIFDDILKPSPNFGPNDSHAKRTSYEKAEESSLFDDTFKQAVEDLQSNDPPRSKEKLDPSANNTEASYDPHEKGQTEASATDKETNDSDQNRSADSNDESAPAAEKPVTETTTDTDTQDDPDDVLIAQVMEAASEYEKNQGEAASNDTSETIISANNLTDEAALATEMDATQSTDVAQEVKASVVTTNETLDVISAAQDPSSQTANPTNQATIASSEIVIPQEAQATAGATQATVSTTTTATESEATNGNATQEVIKASQESDTQQNNLDMDQDADRGDSETTKPQASTLNLPASEGEELTVEATENRQDNSTDHSAKVATSHERPTAAMGQEVRSAQGTSNSATPQNAEPTVDTTDRVRFVERVAQAFNAQSNGNSTIRMRLHPEELGSIKLEMTVRDGVMYARIETETREARNVLMDNLPALRERLANHDIKVEQFEIDYNAGGDQQNLPHSPEDWVDSGRNGSNDPSDNNTSTEEADTTETTRQAASVTGSGEQLDVTA